MIPWKNKWLTWGCKNQEEYSKPYSSIIISYHSEWSPISYLQNDLLSLSPIIIGASLKFANNEDIFLQYLKCKKSRIGKRKSKASNISQTNMKGNESDNSTTEVETKCSRQFIQMDKVPSAYNRVKMILRTKVKWLLLQGKVYELKTNMSPSKKTEGSVRKWIREIL